MNPTPNDSNSNRNATTTFCMDVAGRRPRREQEKKLRKTSRHSLKPSCDGYGCSLAGAPAPSEQPSLPSGSTGTETISSPLPWQRGNRHKVPMSITMPPTRPHSEREDRAVDAEAATVDSSRSPLTVVTTRSGIT